MMSANHSVYLSILLKNRKKNNAPLITRSWIRNLSNNKTDDRMETTMIPTLTIFGNIPLSLVYHAKKAIMGEHNANTVQPIM